ncbi:MAG: hypothetical protein ACLQAT_10935 [Candidatus Binataceae bacterium]
MRALHRDAPAGARDIDTMLREIIARINRRRSPGTRIRLSMFPTPPLEYFIRCAAAADCKAHLRAIARTILRIAPRRSPAVRRNGGWIFTRFMLAGFAAYCALERLGVETFEGYPYLAFSLWKRGEELLPPKSARRAAFACRRKIIARLRTEVGLEVPPPATLDEADAGALTLSAILASRAKRGALVLEGAGSGRFLLPLRPEDMDAASVLIG